MKREVLLGDRINLTYERPVSCLILHAEYHDSDSGVDKISLLKDLLYKRGFNVRFLAEEASSNGVFSDNFDAVAADCHLGIILIDSMGDDVLYHYGYLKGIGKPVINLGLGGQQKGSNGDSKIYGLGYTQLYSDDSPSLKSMDEILRRALNETLPQLAGVFTKDCIKRMQFDDPGSQAELENITREILECYSVGAEYDCGKADELSGSLMAWERSSGKEAPEKVLGLLASVYVKLEESGKIERPELKVEVYNRLIELYSAMLERASDIKTENTLRMKLADVYMLISMEDASSEQNVVESAVALYEKSLEFFTSEGYPGQYSTLCLRLGSILSAAHLNRDGNGSETLEKAAAYLEQALESLVYGENEELCTCIRLKLADTYSKLSSLSENNDYLERAVNVYSDLLSIYEAGETPAEHYKTKSAMADALLSLAGSSGDGDKLEQAALCYEECLGYFTLENSPGDWIGLSEKLGKAYGQLALMDENDPERESFLRKSINVLNAVSEELKKREDVERLAGVMKSLGSAYGQMSLYEDRANCVEREIECYSEALGYYDADEDSEHYADCQTNLGNAYRNKSELQIDAEACILAIECYEKALTVYDITSRPDEYAMVQNNLGAVYDMLAQIEESADHCRSAKDSYGNALNVYTPESNPGPYAMVKNNLGNVYCTLAEIEDRKGNCERAIECYRSSLEYRDASSEPLEYAMTQNNLGVTYTILAEINNDAENYRHAIEAFGKSLEIYGSGDFPDDYAMIQNNLGGAYRDLSEIENTALNVTNSIRAFEEAALCLRGSSPTSFAAIKRNLGGLYRILAAYEDSDENLELSVRSYEEAALVFEGPEYAKDFADTGLEKSRTLILLAVSRRTAESYGEAIAALEGSLGFYTETGYPAEYAFIKVSLGRLYIGLSSLEQKQRNIRNALENLKQSVSGYENGTDLTGFAEIKNNIGNLYSDLSLLNEREKNLELACESYEQSLDAVSGDRAGEVRSIVNSNLLAAKLVSSETGGAREDLEKLIVQLENCLEECAPGVRPAVMNNLAAATRAQYGLSGGEDLLEKSRGLYRQALQSPEVSSVAIAQIKNNLGNLYLDMAHCGNAVTNCKNAISEFADAVSLYAAHNDEEAAALIKSNLGSAYQILARHENSLANIRMSLKNYEDALSVFGRHEYPHRYARIRSNMGLAYVMAGEETDRNENYSKALGSYADALEIYSPEYCPDKYQSVKKHTAFLHLSLYEERKGAGELREAIRDFEELLGTVSTSSDDEEKGLLLMGLGKAYGHLSIHEDGESNRARAVKYYKEALAIYGTDANTDQTGIIRREIEGLIGDTDIDAEGIDLEMAIGYLKEAAVHYDPELFPENYISVHRKLGVAYRKLASDRDIIVNIGLAIDSFNTAREASRELGDKDGFAALSKNIAELYTEIAELRGGLEDHKLALTYYKEALEIYTADEHPELYGEIRKAMGIAYGTMAESEDREDNFALEIDCYKDAINVYGDGQFGDEYANLTRRMGSVYGMLGQAKDELGDSAEAVEHYLKALEYLDPGQFPDDYAYYKKELGMLYYRMASSNDLVANCREALQACNDAMHVYERNDNTDGIAETKSLEKDIYVRLGEHTVENDSEAETVYTEILRLCSPDRVPETHAAVMLKLAETCRSLSSGGTDEQNVNKAEAAYRASLEFYTPDRNAVQYSQILRNMGDMQLSLASATNNIDYYLKAEKSYTDALSAMPDQEGGGADVKRVLAEIYLIIGDSELDAGNYADALGYYERLSALSVQTDLDELAARSSGRAGDVYAALSEIENGHDNWSKAARQYETALKYYSPGVDPALSGEYARKHGNALRMLAQCMEQSGEVNEALQYYIDSIRRYDELGEAEVCALLYGKQGDLYRTMSQLGDPLENMLKSVDCYKEALKLFDSFQTGSEGETVRETLDELFSALSEYQAPEGIDPEEAYRRILSACSKDEYPVPFARILINLAECLETRYDGIDSMKLTEAVQCYREAVSLTDRDKDEEAYAKLLEKLGNAYTRLAGHEKAIQNLKQARESYADAIDIYSSRGEKSRIREICIKLSDAALALNSWPGQKPDEVASIYLDAIEIMNKAEEPELAACLNARLGEIYCSSAATSGDADTFEKARERFAKALESYSSDTSTREYAEAKAGMAAVSEKLAELKQGQGDLDGAEKLYEESLGLYSRDERDEKYYIALAKKADVIYRKFIAKPETRTAIEAEESYSVAIGYYTYEDHTQAYRDIAVCLNELYKYLAKDYMGTGDHTAAAEKLSQSLDLFRFDEFGLRRAEIYYELGQLFTGGNPDGKEDILKASEYFAKALENYPDAEYPAEAALCYMGLGHCHGLMFEQESDSDDLRRAADFNKKALQLLNPELYPEQYSTVSDRLGRIEEKLSEQEADARQEESAAAVDAEGSADEECPVEQEKLLRDETTADSEPELILETDEFEPDSGDMLTDLTGADARTAETDADSLLIDNYNGLPDDANIESLLEKLALYEDDDASPEHGALLGNAASFYIDQYKRENNLQALTDGISCYEKAVKIFNRHEYPEEFGELQLILSGLYLEPSNDGPAGERLDKSLKASKEALKVYKENEHPEEYARIQKNIISCYRSISDNEENKKTADEENRSSAKGKPNLKVVRSDSNDTSGDAPGEQAADNYYPQPEPDSGIPGDIDAQNPGKAAAHYDRMLKDASLEEGCPEIAEIKMKLADSLANVADTESTLKNIRKAIKAYEDALGHHDMDSSPTEYVEIQSSLGDLLRTLGEQSGDPKSFNRALEAYGNALEVLTLENDARRYGLIHQHVGMIYSTLAEIEQKVDYYVKAVGAYEESLKVISVSENLSEYGTVQKNLGIACGIIAEVGGDYDNHRKATRAYEEAISVFDRSTHPIEYAELNKYLGIAYGNIMKHEKNFDYFDKSVDCFNRALEIYSFDTNPGDYGLVKRNMADIYYAIYKSDGDAGNLKVAIEAYEEALKYYSADRVPKEFASIKNLMGAIYGALAEREDAALNCSMSIGCYEDVLKVYSMKEYPREYAATQNNLGIAYRTLADAKDKGKNSKRAVNCYKEALRVYTAEDYPSEYGSTYNNLGGAYATLADVEDKRENCKMAIEAYEEALKVRTIEESPIQFAGTQNNLGVVYRALCEIEDKAKNCKRAINAYEMALIIYTIDKYPVQYAITQNNIGGAYTTLAESENKDKNCEMAISAYNEALNVFTEELFPDRNRVVKNNIRLLRQFAGN